MKTGVLILNRGAGPRGERDAAETAEEICRAASVGELALTARIPESDRLASASGELVREWPELVIVAGGDGTVSTVAGALAGSGVPMGVLPLGTLNHFARDIGMPTDWREALTVIFEGRTTEVDVGELNGRVFVNNCSVGAYPEAVRRRDALRFGRGLRKWPAMTLALIAVFWRLRRIRLSVTDDRGERLLRTPFIIAANNRYSGHVFQESLRERLDEGRLWIYTTRARRHLTVLRLAWQTLVQRIDLTETLDNWPTESVVIAPLRSGTRLPVALDGEVVDEKPPLRIRLRRRALVVITNVVSDQDKKDVGASGEPARREVA